MSERKAYDLVVIGSGTAAQVASFRVRAAGWSVAVIDHLPFGGTCALRGCDPKKMLISGAEAIDMARRMRGRGAAGGCGVTAVKAKAQKGNPKEQHRHDDVIGFCQPGGKADAPEHDR